MELWKALPNVKTFRPVYGWPEPQDDICCESNVRTLCLAYHRHHRVEPAASSSVNLNPAGRRDVEASSDPPPRRPET